jgi:hypothetical protein
MEPTTEATMDLAVDVEATTTTEPTMPMISWVVDHLHRDDSKYRVLIGSFEYIKSTRKKIRPAISVQKPRKPRKPRVYKKVILSPTERLMRKEYMYKYRIGKKMEMTRLQDEIDRLSTEANDASTTNDDASTDN